MTFERRLLAGVPSLVLLIASPSVGREPVAQPLAGTPVRSVRTRFEFLAPCFVWTGLFRQPYTNIAPFQLIHKNRVSELLWKSQFSCPILTHTASHFPLSVLERQVWQAKNPSAHYRKPFLLGRTTCALPGFQGHYLQIFPRRCCCAQRRTLALLLAQRQPAARHRPSSSPRTSISPRHPTTAICY
jgi:hypothetical protein